MNNPVKTQRAIVRFCPGIEVEAFQMPNGSYYVSITTASKAVGYNRNWLTKLLQRKGRGFLFLQSMGFTGNVLERKIPTNYGNQMAKLISIDDFNCLTSYAMLQGKREAAALNLALTKISLHDLFRSAFNAQPLNIEDKIALLQKMSVKVATLLKYDSNNKKGSTPKGYIYLIQMKDTQYYKIGVSLHPIARVKDLQTASPLPLEILASSYSCKAYHIESRLHEHYKAYMTCGEWFEFSSDTASLVRNTISQI